MGVYIRNITKEQFIEDCNAMGVLVITEGISEIDLVRCGECKHLEVINKAPIYAHCHKWSYDFKLWQEDTRKSFCSYGERRTDEHNTERD